MPSIVGGLDIHRKQITFDYLDLVTGEVSCGQVTPADREHFRSWLAGFENPAGVAFAAEACTGWRYVTEELRRAGAEAHLAEPADTAAARGRKRRAKTDRADARLMRDLLTQGRLPECWIPPSHILECRALLELYHDLRAEHTAWVQRVAGEPPLVRCSPGVSTWLIAMYELPWAQVSGVVSVTTNGASISVTFCPRKASP